MACPSHARSVVDSPGPAPVYKQGAIQLADCAEQSRRRYSDLPTIELLAERFARTVAPAIAASVLGGSGTQTSSQISICNAKSGQFAARKMRSLPKGAVLPRTRTCRSRALEADVNL